MFILTKFPLSLQQTEKAREKEVKATKLKVDETHTGRDVEKGVAYTEKLLAGHAVEVKRCQDTMERVRVCEWSQTETHINGFSPSFTLICLCLLSLNRMAMLLTVPCDHASALVRLFHPAHVCTCAILLEQATFYITRQKNTRDSHAYGGKSASTSAVCSGKNAATSTNAPLTFRVLSRSHRMFYTGISLSYLNLPLYTVENHFSHREILPTTQKQKFFCSSSFFRFFVRQQ